MRKSRLTTGIVAGLVLASTAACGAGSGTDDDGKLTFMFRGGEDEKAAYQEAIDRFSEESGVEVEVIVTDADQYATKLQAAISGNNVPDVFYIEQANLQSYVTSGVLLDITDHVEASGVDLDNLWDYGVDSYRYDGKIQGTPEGALYGLPKDVGPFAMGYNKTMLEAEGIEPPSADEPYTWDEWLEILKKVTKDTDGDKKIDQWGTGLNVQWNMQGFAWSNGADWTNEDRTEVTVDTPEMAEALQYIADMTTIDKVTPNAEQAATLDTYQRWMEGQIAFFPVGPWDVSTYNELDFDYDLIPFPAGSTGEPATWIGSLGIGVSATTAMPEEAVELVTYLSADETADPRRRRHPGAEPQGHGGRVGRRGGLQPGQPPGVPRHRRGLRPPHARRHDLRRRLVRRDVDQHPAGPGRSADRRGVSGRGGATHAEPARRGQRPGRAGRGRERRQLALTLGSWPRRSSLSRPAGSRQARPTGSDPTATAERNLMAGSASRLHRSEHRWALAFVAAPVIGYLLFTLYPVCFAVYASLTNWNGLGVMRFVGLDNYVRLLGDANFLESIYNTFFYMIGIPIGLAVSLALAVAMNRKIVGLTAFRTIYYVPVISSLAAIAILWQWAYNGDFGLVNQALALVGIDGPNWLASTFWAKPAIILMAIWKGLGFSMILYLAAIQSVPRSLYEAAQLDGANGWQRFRTITLPMVRPVTFFLVVTNVIGGAQLFTEVNIMTPTGGPEYSTASAVWHIWRQAFKYQQMGYATAMAIVLGLLILVVTLIQFRLNRRNSFDID
jgi:ABC-type sugar transport system permease subunit/ABC-type glycerol-3-phosphate transport system substrate-binding protein